MLKTIQLKNYRCYENSQISFHDNTTIIVGRNNAGKSTLIEAIRLVAEAGRKAGTSAFINTPLGLSIPAYEKGVKIDCEKLRIDLKGVVSHYRDDCNAHVIAIYEDNSRIEILANREIAFARMYTPDNKLIQRKSEAAKYQFNSVSILPQIGLLKELEGIYTQETIVRDKSTYLTSRHFRNELQLYREEYYEDFCSLSELTWPGIRIGELSLDGSNYNLLIRDTDFAAEIGAMGSGLQMWLQIVWFICKSKGASTIILDEPDVYMHPDMQKRILRLAQERFDQVIIATHSVEIISAVEPYQIIAVDKRSRNMCYANSTKAVQGIIEDIGSPYNLSLLRIQTAKRCLFVEGKDIKLLSRFAKRLSIEGKIEMDDLPCVPLGGFSRLKEAYGTSRLFFEETSGEIKCYCILDRDYRNDEIVQAKYREAEANHLILHIWDRKEIENYLIVPEAFFRISRLPQEKHDEFMMEIGDIIESFKSHVQDEYGQFLQHEYKMQYMECNAKVRDYMDQHWTTISERIRIVPGKEVLRRIREHMKTKYNASCTDDVIVRNILPGEVDNQLKKAIKLLTQ